MKLGVELFEAPNEEEDMASTESDAQQQERRTRIGSAAVMVSGLVLLDLPMELLCLRFPLLCYILAAAVGYAIGGRVSTWLTKTIRLGRVLRIGAYIIVTLGVVGATVLSVYHPPWYSKCSWRSCGRVLGPGLFQSPFPAPSTTCQDLHRCANEYRYSDSEYTQLSQYIEKQRCEPL
jgi:hypothetical protein